MDLRVLDVQNWLNSTYDGVDGWVTLATDGQTGWQTIYGLRRGLQHELGITPVTSGFGPATTAAFKTQIGRIDSSTDDRNILLLLSGSLWCKGYAGIYNLDSLVTFGLMADSVSDVRRDVGIGGLVDDPCVDVKLMASLMSMDAYRIGTGLGLPYVREAQRWLNGTYSSRRDFALCPCDGVYSRQIQKAELYGIQYELGMADGVATGNFGPGTKAGLQASAQVGPGSVDSSKRFVRLYQAAMRFNTFDVPLTGSFDSEAEARTREFQSFMEIPTTGRGDYTTWCNLLVSSGDTNIATKGYDKRDRLSAAQLQAMAAMGYTPGPVQS